MCFLGVGYRLVVPSSRGPESVWVGKNLPAKREDDPQCVYASCFFGGGIVSWSYWRATQAFSVILRRSQALPGAPSQSRAFQSSRCLVVPQSRSPVVPWS